MNPKDMNLSKVKLLPEGGLRVNYQINNVVEGEVSVIDRDETCDREIHPDLRGLFEDLRPIVARCFNMTTFLTLLEVERVGEGFKVAARQYADELLKKIEVRGVSWSGTDENVGVVLTAVVETPNGLKAAVNTPRIKVAQISFGFEEELEKITDAIRGEVYQYLFEGKQAQLSLFGQNSSDE